MLLPLTHQTIAQDRTMAEELASLPVPVILGGHEHEIFIEDNAGSVIATGDVEQIEIWTIE